MSRADSKRGHQRERDLVHHLRENNWFAMRAPASLGVADVIAMRDGDRPRMYEVKSTRHGPYAGFPPADRERLRVAAKMAGADCFLCWHPPHGKRHFIGPDEWP